MFCDARYDHTTLAQPKRSSGEGATRLSHLHSGITPACKAPYHLEGRDVGS